jgi:hypothetical protein
MRSSGMFHPNQRAYKATIGRTSTTASQRRGQRPRNNEPKPGTTNDVLTAAAAAAIAPIVPPRQFRSITARLKLT